MRQAVLKWVQAEWAELAISEINQWGRWQPASQPAASKQVVELEPGFLSVEKSTRLDTFPTTFFLASLNPGQGRKPSSQAYFGSSYG